MGADGAEGVVCRIEGDVAYITLDRPSVRNAVSRRLHHELGDVIYRVGQDVDIRFIVLAGSGGTFSSGGDLQELGEGLPPEYVFDYWRRMNSTIVQLRTARQIVVAAVQGSAVGAGAALALAADIVVAEQGSRFRFSFVHLGLLPDAGTNLTLAQSVGMARARDLLLSGRWISAVEAHRTGMIARLAAHDKLDDEVALVLTSLRQAPGSTLALAKSLLDNIGSPQFASAVRTEGVYQLSAAYSTDYRGHINRVMDGMRLTTTPDSDGANEPPALHRRKRGEK
jgi:enoyl-CoA hydratase/carnithine racemase